MQTLRFNTRDVPLRPHKRGRPARGKSTSPPITAEVTFEAQQESSGPQLEFVTTTGPPSERSQTSRYVVRSHAMQAFLHEKNGDGRARPKPDAEMEERNIEELKGRFKLATWSRKNKKTAKGASVTAEKTSTEVANSSRYEKWDSEKPDFTVCRPNLTFGTILIFLKHSQIVRDSLDPYSLLLMPLRPSTKRFLYHCKYIPHFFKFSSPAPSHHLTLHSHNIVVRGLP